MWIDTNKGDDEIPIMRPRLVAKEYRANLMEAIFAGTPPLVALRAIIRIAAAHANDEDPYGIRVVDVSRAHLYAKALRRVFVQSPQEDPSSQDPEACGELLMIMYGTQYAAANWTASYTNTMTGGGFIQGKASPCLFVKNDGSTPTLVHWDDLLCYGRSVTFGSIEDIALQTL